MKWAQCTHIWIFNVGRGLSIFIRSGLNQGFIYDMGSGEEFNPSEFIKKNLINGLDKIVTKDTERSIAQAILSHPHSDHISQCAKLKKNSALEPVLLTCPHDKNYEGYNEKINWRRIANPEGAEDLIQSYKGLFKERRMPLQTIKYNTKQDLPHLEYGIYYIMPPVCEELHPKDDNKYGNSTSIIFYMRQQNHSILIPGDMTPEGMEHILKEGKGVQKRFTRFNMKESEEHPDWNEKISDQPSLPDLLGMHGLTILVAPHHGLESGYSPDLYKAIKDGKPNLVVVSERLKQRANDGNTHTSYYGKEGAFGLEVGLESGMEDRNCISTKGGDHILIIFPGTGRPRVFTSKDPYNLLKRIREKK